jgi:hypothetical protein
VRIATGTGHLIHDSLRNRQVILDAVRDVIARV